MKSKNRIAVPMENDYIQSLIKAFNQFLIEEVTGCVYADLRLKSKLDHARNLYPSQRKALCTRPYFGHYDETNTELVFTSAQYGKEARYA